MLFAPDQSVVAQYHTPNLITTWEPRSSSSITAPPLLLLHHDAAACRMLMSGNTLSCGDRKAFERTPREIVQINEPRHPHNDHNIYIAGGPLLQYILILIWLLPPSLFHRIPDASHQGSNTFSPREIIQSFYSLLCSTYYIFNTHSCYAVYIYMYITHARDTAHTHKTKHTHRRTDP